MLEREEKAMNKQEFFWGISLVCLRRMRFCTLMSLFLLAFLLSGCFGVGHKNLPAERFDYNSAISRSWKEQALLNMVRLRYGDTPVLLNVASVIAQHVREGRLTLTGTMRSGVLGGEGGDSVGLQGTGVWSERPTITYALQTGQEFARSMLTPISPSTIFAMVSAGWPSDLVLGLVIRSIEGIDKYLLDEQTRNPYALNPEFIKILEAFRFLQEFGVFGVRQVHDGKQTKVLISFYEIKLDPRTKKAREFLQTTLHLPPDVHEFPLVFGQMPGAPEEIAILSSSILEIAINLSRYIEVPLEHVEAGYTPPTIQLTADSPLSRPPIRIQATKQRPTGAFLAVRDRGYWFSIAENDFLSKQRFTFMMVMFQLAHSESPQGGPVITVGTGP
jgi:hypothetical protein